MHFEPKRKRTSVMDTTADTRHKPMRLRRMQGLQHRSTILVCIGILWSLLLAALSGCGPAGNTAASSGKKSTCRLCVVTEPIRGCGYNHLAARGAWGICVLLSLILAACGSVSTTHSDTTAGSTARATSTSTSTPTPTSQFNEVGLYLFDDMRAVPLRGSLLNTGGDVHTYTFLINIAPTGTDLATIQWNAYQVQKAIWTASRYRITPGWTVSVRQYINGDAYTGTLIGSADLHEPHGYTFDWVHLSPQQAWAKYDATTYHGE